MAITLNDNIVGTNGVISLTDGTNSTVLRNNQIIQTANYTTCGTYVFKHNINIPLFYVAGRCTSSSANGTVTLNYLTTAQSSNSNLTLSVTYPSYYSQLVNVMQLRTSKSFKCSVVQSQVSYSSTVGKNELSRFNSYHDFVSSYYSLSYKAPVVRHNDQAISSTFFSSSYASIYLSGNTFNLKFITQANYNFMSISVVL